MNFAQPHIIFLGPKTTTNKYLRKSQSEKLIQTTQKVKKSLITEPHDNNNLKSYVINQKNYWIEKPLSLNIYPLISEINGKGKNSVNFRFQDKSKPNQHKHKQPRIKNMGFTNQMPIFRSLGQHSLKNKFSNPKTKYKLLSCINWKKALDVTSIEDHQQNLYSGRIIIWTYHGGPNQHFYIYCSGNRCRIISVVNGFCITVPNSDQRDGAQLSVSPIKHTINEIFQLVSYNQELDLYFLQTFCGKVVDIKDDDESNGSPVIQWQKNNGKNQVWKIVSA